KGRIVVRAEVRLEETPRSRLLIVTQLPPIGRDKLKASLVKAINARKLEGLMPELRDESDTEKGTRIVLELRKDADAAQVLSQLFNETDLQISLSFQMVFLFGESMQADVSASMTLAQVTRLEASKYEKEKEELQTRIKELERLLGDRNELIALLKKAMQQLIKDYGDDRRSVIEVEGHANAAVTEVVSLHEREPLVIAFTRNGTLKTLPADTFTPKGKNGDAIYTPVRGDEQLRQLVAATSQDYVLCVCSTGRIFQVAAHRIPQGTRPAKGEPVRKLLELAPHEELVAVLPVKSYDEDRYLVTFSKLGKVKKSP